MVKPATLRLVSVVLVLSSGIAARAQVTCPVDTERFVHRGPGFTDRQTGVLWRYCTASQGIEPKTQRCLGAIFATEKWSRANAFVDRVNDQIAERVRRAAAASSAPPVASRPMFRMPTIDELAQLADARCGERAFGRTPLADYGGAPVWTSSTAGDGRVWQFDPEDGGRKLMDPENAPGVILLVFNLPR